MRVFQDDARNLRARSRQVLKPQYLYLEVSIALLFGERSAAPMSMSLTNFKAMQLFHHPISHNLARSYDKTTFVLFKLGPVLWSVTIENKD